MDYGLTTQWRHVFFVFLGLLSSAPALAAPTNDTLVLSVAHTFTHPVPIDIWYMKSDEASFRWAKQVTIPANWSGWARV